jgi:methyltransferase (TIGR00027 family)
MRPSQASTTALHVAMGRAIAHAEARIPGFSDPIARELLPPAYRHVVDLLASGRTPSGWRDRGRLRIARRVARMIPLRTVAIDHAVRTAPVLRQLVILGAGLDARAWRMDELRDTVVFEVDHPATQAFKRDRTAALRPSAREVRFIPVDFQRDSLDHALAHAGHDAELATAWIWEGVIRYLSHDAIEATLDAIAGRSAPGSRLVVNYRTQTRASRWLGNLVLSWVGEPIRSSFSPSAFAALLAAHGFRVTSDTEPGGWDARTGAATERRRRAGRRHIVIAARALV